MGNSAVRDAIGGDDSQPLLETAALPGSPHAAVDSAHQCPSGEPATDRSTEPERKGEGSRGEAATAASASPSAGEGAEASGMGDPVADTDIALAGGYRIPARVYDQLFPYQQVGVKWMWELHTQRAGGTFCCTYHIYSAVHTICTIYDR